MSAHSNKTASFEQQVSDALRRSAQLAREEGIKYGTGIVVQIDGKMVKISAEELKQQAEQKQKEAVDNQRDR
ncbi:MAG: hypothetical protein M0R76_04395 [Proteobacteria bacterium]|nr:hypothetical protein [Pseudomonadota bacterium]